jgi:hypothetical protein
MFICALCLISAADARLPQNATQAGAADADTILKIEQKLLDAIATGDTIVWNTSLDDSFVVVTEDGSRSTKHDLINSMHGLPKGYSGQIHIAEPTTRFLDNVAVLNYVAQEEEIIYGQKLTTAYATMCVYHKSGATWKLFASQVFEIPKNPPAIATSGPALKNYVGVYTLAEGVNYTVSLSNDTLYGQRTGGKKEQLFPEMENIFFTKSDTRGRKIFVRDEHEKMQMVSRRNGSDLIWTKNE